MTESTTTVHIPALASWIADESAMFSDERSPFQAHATPGSPGLAVVVGENASGKSLFVRVLAAKAQQAGALPVSLSIRERAGSGTAEMARFRQVMMFGDENEQSTGATSVRAIATAFNNLDRPQGSVLLLDEPELGLSQGYARALGEYIGGQALNTPAVCAGVVVVTHSRTLVRGILAAYEQEPTFVSVGTPHANVQKWLEAPELRSVEDLLSLPEVGLERFRAVEAVLRGN